MGAYSAYGWNNDIFYSKKNQNAQFKKDIAHMKHTLDNIAKQVGVSDTIDDGLKESLLELISEGEKIKAVKNTEWLLEQDYLRLNSILII